MPLWLLEQELLTVSEHLCSSTYFGVHVAQSVHRSIQLYPLSYGVGSLVSKKIVGQLFLLTGDIIPIAQRSYSMTHSVFSQQILIGGDFRIIDGEKIWPKVRKPPVGSVKSPGKGAGGSTPADFWFGEFWLAFEGVS